MGFTPKAIPWPPARHNMASSNSRSVTLRRWWGLFLWVLCGEISVVSWAGSKSQLSPIHGEKDTRDIPGSI